MSFAYLLSFLDKQTLNYANAYGLQADVGLVGRDYSWVASVTKIVYLIFSYPSSACLQRFPDRQIRVHHDPLLGRSPHCDRRCEELRRLSHRQYVLDA